MVAIPKTTRQRETVRRLARAGAALGLVIGVAACGGNGGGGDGAFSSAGAFGFYPWIDASKTWYGIVARMDSATPATRTPPARDLPPRSAAS